MKKEKAEIKKNNKLVVSKESVDTYELKYKDEKFPQKAEVTFRNGEFEGCVYDGVCETYDLEDWNFINLLSKEIIALAKKYNK